ncbi:MAG: hypothetical protein PHE29_03730 [Tissierellia bacterium]|nr:hypothetical protein [Tissierellia bacterium]MDD4781169.1 hypothetical protein [Tissierellia bacterium]
MKKYLSLFLVLVMVLAISVGCSQQTAEDPKDQTPVEEPKEEEKEKEEAPAAGDAVKTGMAVISSIGKSKDAAADAEGNAQVDSVVVAVMVDNDGKIVKAKIDTAQTKIGFSNEGKVTTDLATVFKAKQDLGTEYGMSKASKIGKEWNEQANAFADYILGKTVEEIKGFKLDEETHLTDEDITASVTIKVGGYIEAIEKAVANAQDLGAKATDTLGLGVETTIGKSKDAAADAEGVAQAYTHYVATTFDADGKITSCVIDASQSNVNFDVTGKITTDLAAPLKTKVELGDDYGMKSKSNIGKEWYEQADAFSKYVVGKTVEEVKGIAVDETGHATEADLTASVTAGIGEFQAMIEKAKSNAK